MDDVIGRKEAIDQLHQAYNLLDAERRLEDMPFVTPKQRWIPCSERLPEYGKTVLWCNDMGSVFTTAITYKNDNSWAIGKRHRCCRVIAWMPLPEPYKEEGEQDA